MLMAPQIDFAAIKEAVSLEQAKDYLGLSMKFVAGQFRSGCPTCKAGGDRALAITPNKGFYCFHVKKGGDVIALVSHIRGCSQREAAVELQEQFLRSDTSAARRNTTTSTKPERAPGGMQPIRTLTNDHEVIELLGLSKTVCNKIGIGYDVKGEMKGRIAFPLRLPDGTLVGYLGLATTAEMEPLILLTPDLDSKITPETKGDDVRKFLRLAVNNG
jgi:hypothetical protein